MSEAALSAVVLAGDREGGSALARGAAVDAGVLVPVGDRTLIEHVIAALRHSDSVNGGVIVGPVAAVAETSAVMRAVLAAGDYRWIAPAGGPSASARAGVMAANGFPVLLTAGDHALLEGAIVDAFCSSARALDADFVVGLVPHAQVRAAFPESRRTVLRFRDGAFCGSNLFLVRTSAGLRALDFWRTLERDRKRPWRMALHLGPAAIARYVSRTLSIGNACAALSRRAGCRVTWTPVPAARAAVDVDTAADRALAERVLAGG